MSIGVAYILLNTLYSSLAKILFILYYLKSTNIMSKTEEDEKVKSNKEEEEKKKKLFIEEKQPENPLPVGEGHETKVIDEEKEEN